MEALEVLTGALGFAAALAWHRAGEKLVDKHFPKDSGVGAAFVYAALVSVVIFLVVRALRAAEPHVEVLAHRVAPKLFTAPAPDAAVGAVLPAAPPAPQIPSEYKFA
jgi:hypothetical protein